MASPTLVLLGLGANLGNPGRQLQEAVRHLREELGALLVSYLYRSAPVGFADQPDFLNLVCGAETHRSLDDLLALGKQVEIQLRRKRSQVNAPRTIDVDLLSYANLVIDAPNLILPHPRLHQRAFVLAPLAEIAPRWRHPIFGKTPAELMQAAGPLERIERVGPMPD